MGRPSYAQQQQPPVKLRSGFKLERLPDYLRETVDWIIGRSRRKDVKENCSKRVASASYVVRQPPKQSEMCVCDSIDEKMVAKLTALPTGIDKREWVAHNTLGLFDHINALCGSMSEVCVPVTCTHMSFPGTSKASYADERGKRQYYPAMQYIDCVMSQCEQISRNEEIFPTKYGNTFSNEFEPTIKKMVKLLWHCIGHLYTKHWHDLGGLDLRPQAALVMAHLAELSRKYELLCAKDQAIVDTTVLQIRPIITAEMAEAAAASDSNGSSGDRAIRVPSSKSGSWGGHPSPAVLTCKTYSQTC